MDMNQEIKKGDLPAVQRRIRRGEKPKVEALLCAVEAPLSLDLRRKMLETLLDAGAPINALPDGGASRVLNSAIAKSRHELVPFLIQRGADINAPDGWGKSTPLHAAVTEALRSGRTDTLELLLNQPGINVTAKNQHGHTPLDLAKKPTNQMFVSTVLNTFRVWEKQQAEKAELARREAEARRKANLRKRAPPGPLL